jgi:hypothetical protein
VVLLLVLLASCQRHQPVFIVNHRDVPVQVVYRNEVGDSGEGRVRICELRENKPRLFRGTDVDEFRWPDIVELPSAYDEVRCEITVTLPPKSSVVIGMNEFCSGATEYIGREGFRPRLNYLHIEGAGGGVELRGWEVARALVERRGVFSHGDCRYELR